VSRQEVVPIIPSADLPVPDRLFRWIVLRGLRGLRFGRIRLRDRYREFVLGSTDTDVPAADLEVHDPRFYRRVALGGALGAAESYALGWWSCEDLTRLLRIFVRELSAGEAGSVVTPRLLEPVARLVHFLRRNTRSGSRRNIHDHYDLGNDFFRLFLDDTMTYSCGIFAQDETTLREASLEKIDRICRKLRLEPQHRVVEIGSGWGSFALHAASRYGCHVTTTTVSREQYDYVRDRVRAEGLEDRIEVLLRDYRDLEGRYDRLVSIEMIEAVGHDHLETYLATCDRLLTEDGTALLQAIVMPDRDHAAYLRSVDFIQKYIFPGSCLPSLGSMTRAMGRAASLRIEHVEDIGLHYARTLRHWRERFHARSEDLRAAGRSDRFLRLWHYYFCYCEAGFAEKYLGNLQVVLAKPRARLDAAELTRSSGGGA
jgi:cyclopropane-fatty-acyl-phospholipid synthase